jgi:stringent starvation protein B
VTAATSTSTRPYLIRAIYEWCTENGLTPYLAVHVDHKVQVPMEHVKNNEIVLNISFDATSGLKLGNDWVEFKARFSGSARDIVVPVDHVIAIYARENGQGMSFPMPALDGSASAAQPVETPPASPDKVVKLVSVDVSVAEPTIDPEPPKPNSPRPTLKRVK